MKNEEIIPQKQLILVDESIRSIMVELSAIGCRALIVGGAVRDAVLGIIPKDMDIEVYNMSYADLEAFLERHGKVDLVGKSFGIIKFKPTGSEEIYDVSVPRRENKVGVGHKAFEVIFDPSMTIKEAATRRDITINSMAYDPIENTIYDYFAGMDDIKNRILRHTSDQFKDDPLRIERLMQFQSRLGFEIHPDTIQIVRDILATEEYESLPKERKFEEWKKWAEKGVRHDLIFQFMRDTNLIFHYPELRALKETLQDKIYHPEGDVEIHTARCLVEMDKIIEREKITGHEKVILVMAILLHDIGKMATTREEIKRIETCANFKDDPELRKGKLLFIRCSSQIDLDKKEGQLLVNNEWIEPIIISDTENIQVGDIYAMNLEGWFIMNPCQDDQEADRCNNHYSIKHNCRKILALPENISSKHIQAIEEGKLKDGDEVFIGRLTITSNGHEALGGKMSVEFLSRLGFHEELITPISNLVADHLASVSISCITARSGKLKTVKRLSRRLHPATIQELLYVIESDHNGRGSDMHKDATGSRDLLELAKEMKVENKQYEYILMGRHLIDEKLKPGPIFGEILRAAEEAQENGAFQDLDAAILWLKKHLSEQDGIVNQEHTIPKKIMDKIVVMGMRNIDNDLPATMHIHHDIPLAMPLARMVPSTTTIPPPTNSFIFRAGPRIDPFILPESPNDGKKKKKKVITNFLLKKKKRKNKNKRK